MRDLERASRLFCIDISDFQRQLNEEYRLRELSYRAAGEAFPQRLAEEAVRETMTAIVKAGIFSPIQSATLNAVVGAWQPPHPKK